MVDDSQEMRRIRWGEFFDFTHIFKSFMMVRRCFWQVFLVLAALALVQLAGMTMDWVWSWFNSCAQPQDVLMYYQAANKSEYDRMVDARRQRLETQLELWFLESESWQRLQPVAELYQANGGRFDSPFWRAFQTLLTEQQAREQAEQQAADKEARADKEAKVAAAHAPDASADKPAAGGSTPARSLADRGKELSTALEEIIPPSPSGRSALWRGYERNVHATIARAADLLDDADDKASESLDAIEDRAARNAARDALASDRNAARRALWGVEVQYINARRDYVFGQGLYHVLVGYEADCFSRAVAAVRRGQIFTGFGRVLRHQRNIAPPTSSAAAGLESAFHASELENEPVGVLGWIFLMTQGALWLGGNYPLFAAIFAVAAMAVWALFGGAATRIAAVYAAREESVSMGAALRFVRSRFFSFFSAPLIPLLLILFCGVLMGLGGLLATLPLGDVAVGVLFLLPVILGCVIAFLAIGVVVGLPLMYPTIAVEGSDSFDAISRSLHYSFTRPWRYALYSLVAAAYGAVCYLFIRLFVFVALISTHFFVANGFFGAGASSNPAPELAEGAGKMDLLWTRPTLDDLVGGMNTPAMGFTETLASFFIHMWVYLLAGLVAAFVICIAVNCSTQIYYLLRRRVDAADIDDVYMGEPQDDEDDAVEDAPQPEAPADESVQTSEKINDDNAPA